MASRGRRGTFVTATVDDRYAEAQGAARTYLAFVTDHLGFTPQEAREILELIIEGRQGAG